MQWVRLFFSPNLSSGKWTSGITVILGIAIAISINQLSGLRTDSDRQGAIFYLALGAVLIAAVLGYLSCVFPKFIKVRASMGATGVWMLISGGLSCGALFVEKCSGYGWSVAIAIGALLFQAVFFDSEGLLSVRESTASDVFEEESVEVFRVIALGALIVSGVLGLFLLPTFSFMGQAIQTILITGSILLLASFGAWSFAACVLGAES